MKNNNDDKNDLDGESKYYFDVKNIAAAYYNMPVIFRDQIPMYVHFFWTAFCPFNSWYFKELVRLSRSVRIYIKANIPILFSFLVKIVEKNVGRS